MVNNPKIGQVVYLNEQGMDIIGGLKSFDAIKQAQRMVITYVGSTSLTTDIPCFDINIDQPLIDRFVITNHEVNLLLGDL